MSKKHAPAPPSAGGDDLELVPGIGPKIADALRAAGIGSLDDLVTYTPEQLSSVLARHGVRIGPERIADQQWLRWAEAARTQPDDSDPGDAPAVWHELASFTVAFETTGAGERQTRLYDNTTGEEGVVEGHERQRWGSWIEERMRPGFDEAARVVGPDVDGTVTGSILPVRTTDGTLEGLRLSVRFTLSHPPADRDECTDFRVEAHLVERDSGNVAMFKDRIGTLESGRSDYETSLVFPVPPDGRYELYNAVRIGDADAITSVGPSFTLH